MYTCKVEKRLWLYELRDKHNLSRSDMARILGICESHYARIELGQRGLRGSLQRDYFVTISEYFGIPLKRVHEMEDAHLAKTVDH
jgi:Helix-turn-helix.